jgi:hypothetical protein
MLLKKKEKEYLKKIRRKYVKSQKARGGTGTPVHTRHRHSAEYNEETRE